MAERHDTQLRWAVIDNQLQEISAFSHLAPPDRPPAFCPVCNRPVTMKLGAIRVYHCAHQPNDICSATNPETALHLNMKFYIAEQLKKADKLFVRERCLRCGNTRSQLKFSDWNEVFVERTVGPYRPDIVLLGDDGPVGAIEVFVTHQVDEKKAIYYERRQIEWIEVVGDEAFYDGPYAWTADKPIPVYGVHPPLPIWDCPSCRRREQELEAERERLRKQQEYRKNNHDDTLYSRLVDFYYPSGKKWREWYFIKQRVKGGKVVDVVLGVQDRTVLARQSGPLDSEKLKQLQNACQKHIDTKGPLGTVIDQHMGWRDWKMGQKFHVRDLERFPFRYDWDAEKRTWVQYIQDTWY